MMTKKAELQKYDNYHFVIAGFTQFKEILKKLKKAMPYYRFEAKPSKNIKEIFYDNEYNMLSDAGIVLSKSITSKDTYFNIRRLSRVLQKRNKKYKIAGTCKPSDHPKNYAPQIASAIDDSFSSALTIDLENIVKKTKEIIELDIDKTPYDLICGSGFRAGIIHENVMYKDIKSGRKVFQECISLTVPSGEYPETEEILRIIDRAIPSLVRYNESRFELAQKLLYSQGTVDLPQENNE
ncbi:MAG: hypothetical protein IJX25_03615 [Clostridia bacterium]|nr:hypothetical protein [Clostridia bacterium]MBQ8792158.1 hypothetical protein [Clostridia bacterium]